VKTLMDRNVLKSFCLTASKALLTAAVLVAPRPIAAAASVVSEDVPVPGGTTALARAIGIEPAPDRARFVSELGRLIYGETKKTRENPDSMYRRLLAYLKGDAVRIEAPGDLVPIPLPAVAWSQAVFHRSVAPADLFAAVMSDPAAALLAHGLAALDDETLQFLVDHPAVVTRLYEHDAPVFAGFAEHLQIHHSHVVPPGGDRAVPLWEALLNEKVAQPDRFVRELFARDEGRIAYLYDIIGHLEPSRAAFALGLWIEDASIRVDRFKALASLASVAFHEWHANKTPFTRPPQDLLSMFSRVQVSATGRPGFPARRTVWARAFDSADLPDEPARELTNVEEDTLIDAAWLAEAMLSGVEARSRMERLDQFAFGHRVFAAADVVTLPDVLVALRAFPRFRMLMLTLERIGVGRPSVYASMARQAQRLSSLDGPRAYTALAQFQGAIALITRLASVGTIDRATAEMLLVTLGAVPFNQDRRCFGAFAQWLQLQLRPALPAGNDMEGVLLEALAGAPGKVSTSRVAWEGQLYRFDLVTSEARRLRRIRERQGGASIDVALDLHAIAQRLAAETIALNDIQPAIAALKILVFAKPKTGTAERPAAAVGMPRDPQETVDRAIRNLAKIRTPTDLRHAAQAAEPLSELADDVLGEVLLSFSYAADLGDPEGTARFAANLARRHDFGFAAKDHETRVRTAWALPRQMFEAGVPWHVKGAVLGLDIALAPLALRRIHTDPLTSAPTISTLERATFATSLALINPFALHDPARDAIAEAVARGQRRVEALKGGDKDVHALAREIAMDGWRVRALRWTIGRDPDRLGSLFSMTDLLYLGGGADVDLSPWGMSALASLGCICTRLAAPGLSAALIGRGQLGLLATTVADLNLRVAVILRELQLPAALVKSVLAAAVQDFLDRVRPSDVDDWLTLVRTAQGVSRERVEDYVAAATVDGPLEPETRTQPLQVP
jgi:hypothetical protein